MENSHPGSMAELNISRMSMEAQEKANQIESQRLKLEKRTSNINTITAIAAVTAAIAAIFAAFAAFSSKETIELFIETTNIISK